MPYTKITPFIHLITNPCDRKKLQIEVVMTAAGSIHEKPKDRGKKHLMEHCIATRSGTMEMQEFKDWQSRENIIINAYTSPLRLAVNASTHYSKFEPTLDICLEMIFMPTFDQPVLDQEKEIVLREISQRSGEPEYITYYHTMDKIFTEGSLMRHQTLGDSAMVAQTTVEDLQRLHHQNLQNSHIIIKASGGGIDEQYIINKVNHWLANKEAHTITDILNPETKLAVDFYPTNYLKKFHYMPVVHELAHQHCDLTVFIPCDVNINNKAARKIFDELYLQFFGKLYHRLRDEKGYIYSMYSEFNDDLQNLEINLSCELIYIQNILDEIKDIFGDFDKYYDDKKFNEFKDSVKIKLDIANDNLSALPSFVQKNLTDYSVVMTFEDYENQLDAVTKEDIKAIYQSLKYNIHKAQIVAVSKDINIESLELQI
jgi:predicted Zn-dependent peptidase